MKKVININFQGRIIPIEEDAYEDLKKYVESLRQYFANEEGKEEIINDIENRIAELFSEKLKAGTSVFISDQAVASIIASIGRPEEFDADNIELGSTAYSSTTSNQDNFSSSKQKFSSASGTGFESRGSLYRNENDKILGGVCSGLGVYLRIDTTIIRIIFALFTLGAFGSGLIIYIILSSILPSKSLENNFKRRLYRDAEQKVLGGVCSGLAKYFNIAVWIPRLIFVLPIILSVFRNMLHFNFFFLPFVFTFSGTLFITYLILWAVIPKAITASEKLEMRGEKVDLESIKNKVQDEMQGVKKNFTDNAEKWKQDFSNKATGLKEEAGETARRFAGEAGPSIRKNGNRFGRFILTLIKVFFFFILSIIAFALVMAIFGLVTVSSSLMPLKNFIAGSQWIQVYAWGTVILFFIVPVVALVVWLIRNIAGIKKRNQYLAYSWGILWTLGWVAAIMLVATVSKEFKREGFVSNDLSIVQPSSGKMKVEFKDAEGKYYPLDLAFESFDDNNNDNNNEKLRLSSTDDSLLIGNISIRLIKSNDQNFHVTTVKKARSSSTREAERIAEMISFPVDQSDSILTLPIAFPITTETKFRNQKVRVQIEVPVGKEIFINDRANNLQSYSVRGNGNGFTFDWDNDNGYNYMWTSGSWYIMTERGLEKKGEEEESIIDNRIENFKKKIKEMNGSVDSVSMKIKNGDTTVDIKIRTNDLADIAEEEEGSAAASTKSNTKQAGRILFLWHSLLRFGI
jgi:phage shock protein PspC (stress-responsive transcriptional regulator)